MNLSQECDFPAATGLPSDRPVATIEEPGDDEAELRCAARHLAVAAAQLARAGDLRWPDAGRLASAEALFRARAGADGIHPRSLPVGPVVRVRAGDPLPLTVLFTAAHRRERRWFPCRSIDPELVHEAKELLCGLAWLLPGEEAPAESPAPSRAQG